MRTMSGSSQNRGKRREESGTTCGRNEARQKVEELVETKVIDPAMRDLSSAAPVAYRRIKPEPRGVAALGSDAEVALRFPLGKRVARPPRKG